MGLFKFNTIHTWDVAHHHGHSTFRLLRIVNDIETEYRDINDQLPHMPQGQAEHLKLLGTAQYLTKEMFRISCASVMMFQGMMEAIINDSLEREATLAGINKGSSFRSKWNDALTTVGKDVASFEAYRTDIYRKFRNPMVHPKDVEMGSFNDLSFATLINGFKNGWLAYEMLYDGLGHSHDPDSWEIMCAAYEVPSGVHEAP